MKRIINTCIVITLALILVFAVAPQKAYADEIASGECGYNATWSLSDSGVLTIGGYGAISDYGYDSNKAPWRALYEDTIVSVVIGDDITRIGAYAFYGCDNLVSVTAGTGLTNIGRASFSGCAKLTTVTLNGTLANSGLDEFSFYRSGITSLPNLGNVTYIPKQCFDSCNGLTSVTIPEGVYGFGYNAFHECKNLTSLILPASAVQFESGCFYDCGFTSVTIPSVVNSMGDYSFYKNDGGLTLTCTVSHTSRLGNNNKICRDESTSCDNYIVYSIPGYAGTSAGNTSRRVQSGWNYYTFKSAVNNIHFDANGGNGSMSDWTVTFKGNDEDCIPANTFTAEGATFAGWNTKKDGTGYSYSNQAKLDRVLALHNGSATLYAQWTPNEQYDMYIEGVRVNSFNKNDILGDGTVSYDPTSKVLTLNGYDSGTNPDQYSVSSSTGGSYSYSMYDKATILVYKPSGVNIHVTSNSVIRDNPDVYGSIALAFPFYSGPSITIDDDVTLTVSDSNGPCAIYPEDNLVINGPGTLNVTGGTSSGNAYAIFGSATINGANVTLTGGNSTSHYGHGLNYGLTVNSGTAVVTGDKALNWGTVTAGEGLRIFAGTDASNVTVYSESYQTQGEPYIKVGVPATFNLTFTASAGQAITSGTSPQSITEGDAITDIVVTAADGYYFPSDGTYTGSMGLTVTRNNYKQLTISGTPTSSGTFTIDYDAAQTKLDASGVTFTAMGPNTGTISGLTAGGNYTFEFSNSQGAGSVSSINSQSVVALDDILAGNLTIKMLAIENYAEAYADSDPKVISVTKPAAPALSEVQPTTVGGKGSIPTTAAHEYSIDEGTSWTACTGALSQADPGTYLIRVAASGTALASDTQSITINLITQAETPVISTESDSDQVAEGCAIPTTAGQEISSDGGATWSPCTGESKDLEPGSYMVRTAASGTVLASAPATVNVGYVIMDGAGGNWVLDNPDTGTGGTDAAGLDIRSNGKYENFQSLQNNGVTIDPQYYTTKKGSTIVTLSSSYLSSLTPGTYSITFMFIGGSVTTPLTVSVASASPNTGDSGYTVWALLAAAALITMLGTVIISKKRAHR